jgi:NAD(P)H dehydrogenase (quinone)
MMALTADSLGLRRKMNIFIVFAHPEGRSLNATLRDIAIDELQARGHEVRVSDLYAQRWKAQVDRADFPAWPVDERLEPRLASKDAFISGTLTDDVKAEQDKLEWADAVIVQFPLWWFSMPAILKGWFERVYSHGYAYGVGEYTDKRWGNRYGEGVFAGKRAMILMTTGGWPHHYSARGINGPMEDLLFPINHGILYYPGFDVLPPFIVYNAQRLEAERFDVVSSELRQRMRDLFTIRPIPYRQQNGGDYRIPQMLLQDHIKPGQGGFSVHLRDADEEGPSRICGRGDEP